MIEPMKLSTSNPNKPAIRLGMRWLIGLWLALLVGSTQADDRPLLWLLEDRGQTSYLFGTIHSGHPQLNQLPAKVEQSFAQADRFYAELELSPATIMATAQLMRLKPPQRLTQLLPVEVAQRLNRLLNRLAPGLQLSRFDQLKPWAFAMTLALLEDQLQHGQQPAMDMQLYQRALAAGKPAAGLETPEQQVAVFDSLTQQQQLQLVKATLEAMEQSQNSQQPLIDETYQAYRQGDPDQLESLFDQQLELDPQLRLQLKQRLIDRRNRQMAEQIISELKQHPGQSLFVAVGAAHFGSHSGIQQQLKQRGYQVSRAAAP